jgi:branched-chain amino acid transport system permease protein
VTGQLGGELGVPLPVWLLGAAIFGGLIGAVIGPFALRLRGNYLAIVTLGLVFLGEHLFRNLPGSRAATRGRRSPPPRRSGRSTSPTCRSRRELLAQPGLLLAHLGDRRHRRAPGQEPRAHAARPGDAGRPRPRRRGRGHRGADRALQDGAFAVSSALAAVGGALLGAYQQFVSPDEFSLFLSIQYIAIIIVGGVGTIFGSILGAIVLGGLPGLIDRYSGSIPGVATSASDDGFISVFSLNQAIFGLLIVLFLVFEPRGLAAVWLRVKAYFQSWPFSY